MNGSTPRTWGPAAALLLACCALAGLTGAGSGRAHAAGPTTTFSYTGEPQTYTVPAGVTFVTITAVGAHGGNNEFHVGGLGVSMQGTFSVTPGSTLTILVGGQPRDASGAGSAGGGGGSFVWTGSGPASATNLLIAAGGGGGTTGPTGGADATTGPAGTNGGNNVGGQGVGGIGGSNGQGGGGGGNDGSGGAGGGGGGLLTDGMAGAGTMFPVGDDGGGGGHAISSGGAGGSGEPGGFGGGGGGTFGGGGGGGYSGGGGGAENGRGGGGASFNAGTNQVNAAGVGTGNGSVVITSLPASPQSAPSPQSEPPFVALLPTGPLGTVSVSGCGSVMVATNATGAPGTVLSTNGTIPPGEGPGQVLYLIAVPCSGHAFSGWSGGPCDGTATSPCQLEILSGVLPAISAAFS